MTQWISNFHIMLFDDTRLPSKNAYHLMLSAFYYSGCHDTYFKLIDTYMTDDWRNEYPSKSLVFWFKYLKAFSFSTFFLKIVCLEQTELLLLAWLKLAERLVNSYAVKHSKFTLPESSTIGKRFNVEKYLCLCQQVGCCLLV